jgi:hypothetical protein
MLPRASNVSGFNALDLIYLVIVILVLFAPLLLGRAPSPPESPDQGPDDGWGGSSPTPRPSPISPTGGIPLPDAEHSRLRLRSHRPPLHRTRIRQRPAHPAPSRTPTRTPSHA